MATHDERPAVGVVIPTHNRPELMRRALRSVLEQAYAGRVEVVVVFDRSEPDESLVQGENHDRRSVRVLGNTRTPGLAGARNTGILALQTPVIAFCDDDDVWLPDKLSRQMQRLDDDVEAQFVTTAMRVDYADRSVVRLAGKDRVELDDFVRSRMAMLHSSSFLFRREAMLDTDGFGLVDETIPRSMGEDWDILLRAARHAPVAHVDEPLVGVLWGASSYFNDVWVDKNAATLWLLEHHPEMAADDRARAHMHGKLAFGHASLGQRREALRHVVTAWRANPRQSRLYIALLVVAGVPGRWITVALNKRGHGI